jgi:Putative transposase
MAVQGDSRRGELRVNRACCRRRTCITIRTSHWVVPGGDSSPDGTRWIGYRPDFFFLPVRVLSRLFRRLSLNKLRAAFEAGELGFFVISSNSRSADTALTRSRQTLSRLRASPDLSRYFR